MEIPVDVIEQAKRHAVIEASIRNEEHQVGIAACYDETYKRWAFYTADAWTEPEEAPLLPWRAPKLKPLAIVDKHGKVTPV